MGLTGVPANTSRSTTRREIDDNIAKELDVLLQGRSFLIRELSLGWVEFDSTMANQSVVVIES